MRSLLPEHKVADNERWLFLIEKKYTGIPTHKALEGLETYADKFYREEKRFQSLLAIYYNKH